MKSFYSHGKLLLTGEYAVLDGARSLALPTKFGQMLNVTENRILQLHWTSLDEKGRVWFEGIFKPGPLSILSNSDDGIAKMLFKILNEAQHLNPDFLADRKGYKIETRLDFPRDWGLGTSSTLINNIAQWAGVDAFELSKKTFGGSGYDIACAQNDRPILYRSRADRPEVEKVVFNPDFSASLYFVHLNKKQNSREEILRYSKKRIDKTAFVKKVSELTNSISNCRLISEFQDLLNEHEDLISNALNTPKIKDLLFQDFGGSIKSLGAWGGDFILAVGNENTPDYFKKKGYETVIPFNDMILNGAQTC